MSQHDKGSSGRLTQLVEDEGFPKPLNQLLSTYSIEIRSRDKWQPSVRCRKEATIRQMGPFLPAQVGVADLLDWWLVVQRGANTPNWDLISTCSFNGKEGLLLVEAKAHVSECSHGGKRNPSTPNGTRNHERISERICAANAAWNALNLGEFRLSVKTCYQLSNRMTWLWHLAELGVPTVLLYLGFTKDQHFRSDCFRSPDHWRQVMNEYAGAVMPSNVIGRIVKFGGTSALVIAEAM
jgi:hypothetical protein